MFKMTQQCLLHSYISLGLPPLATISYWSNTKPNKAVAANVFYCISLHHNCTIASVRRLHSHIYSNVEILHYKYI